MAIAALPSDRQDPPAGGLCGVIHEGLDHLDGELDALAQAEGVTARQLGAVMRELTRLVNRAQALHDKGAAIASQIDVAARTGARSTGQWLAGVTQADPRTAHRQASRAEAAGLAAPTLTPVGEAQLAGDISREHVEVVQQALATLPEDVTPETRDRCEGELIRLATGHSPRDLRRLGRRILEQVGMPEEQVDEHEHDQVAAQEDRAWERSSFWIRDNGDGTMHGQFTVPTLAGQALKGILDAMSSPRRAGRGVERADSRGNGGSDGDRSDQATGSSVHQLPGGRDGQGLRELPAWLDPELDQRTRQLARQQRQGQDLATLLTHLPTDHLHDKTAATVLVTTRLSDLQGLTARVGSTAGGEPVTAGQVRQVACQSGVVPAVIGSESQPLDLGRQTRFFTVIQRAALALTNETCAAEGCDIPFAWTDTHHLNPWQSGGRTDLANAVPLCGHHHRALDRGYDHTVRRDGPRLVITLSKRRT